MVFDLEVGGDQRWGLTSDPCGEWLSALSLVILYYLDLRWRAGGDKYIKTFRRNTNMRMKVDRLSPVCRTSTGGTLNTHAGLSHDPNTNICSF